MSAYEEISRVLFPHELKGKFQYPPQELVDQLEPDRRGRLQSLAAAASELELTEVVHTEQEKLVHALVKRINDAKAALPPPPTFHQLWRESLGR